MIYYFSSWINGNKSLEIHSMLMEKGISSEVVNCRFIKPMDENYLNESLAKYKLVVTIEEGVTDGGFGEGIINFLIKRISKFFLTLGVPNRFVDHGPRNILLEEIGLDSMTLFEKIYNFSRNQMSKKLKEKVVLKALVVMN